MPTLVVSITLFVLALLIGIEVIGKVPATLHTPLMSGANSIHGIVIVGVVIVAAEANSPLAYVFIFLAAVLGVENLQAFTNLLPAFVMNGLSVSGGMLVAVGFAILTSMIWSKELGIYFFIGFACVKFLHLPIIGVSIFALAAAILNYTRQGQIKKMKDEIIAQLPENQEGNEDLFG